MASYRNENRPDSGDLLSWIITIVLLVSPVWPHRPYSAAPKADRRFQAQSLPPPL